MKKEKMRFDFKSHDYEAPFAEKVALENEGLLCASMDGIDLEDFSYEEEEFYDENGWGWDGETIIF